MSCNIAIIGGGPGGLMTAYLLQKYSSTPLDITLYEASSRLGGKIRTEQFTSAPVAYEAGAAELYDYSHVGEDPLRELVAELGISTAPMRGARVMMDGQVFDDLEDVGRVHGTATHRALAEFDARARRWMSPQQYYDSDWRESESGRLPPRSFDDELLLVPDDTARAYLECLLHSDIATEPHLTSAAYGLQNYLMNDPAYMELYTLRGGIEQLPQALAARLRAQVRLHERVIQVERTAGRRLRVVSTTPGDPGKRRSQEYDFVVAALPNTLLPSIAWEGAELRAAMHRHYVHHHHPAHYLRVSVLFRESFWKDFLRGSYCMLDAFGGCCLYDESARNDSQGYGVLGWLLAGNAAATAGNETDATLIEQVLDSLPAPLQHGRQLAIEGRVHRWIGAVNGMPGGEQLLDIRDRHLPDPTDANLYLVGDYLFDSTLNGVLDSASYVAETIVEQLEQKETAHGMPAMAAAGR